MSISSRSYGSQASARSRSVSPSFDSRNYEYKSDGYSDDFPKKKRSFHGYREGEVDRISELPDPIILHILSFSEAQDVVRSGILSKRFAYLWTRVDRLSFGYSSLESIRNTLYFHKLSNLRKLSVKFDLFHYINKRTDDHYAVELDRCIRILSLENVKDMTLNFVHCTYTLPQHFYSNSEINKLNLWNCKIKPNGAVNWESLQSLSITVADMPNDRVTDVVDGCPSLEILELSDCQGFTRISLINNKRFRKLVIRDYREVGATLKIDAPHLESFVLSGQMRRFRCEVLNVKSLVDCSLNFFDYSKNKNKAVRMLTSLLEDVCHVKDFITIGEWGLQVLSLIERDGLPFPMFKSTVKCLKLDTKLTAAVMPGIMCLLRGLNCLEKLFITKNYSWEGYDLPYFRRDVILYLASEDMEADLDLKLKTVEISGFRPWKSMNFMALEVLLLVRFLMKNASFLEKVTIICADGSVHSEALRRLLELLSFRRSSPRAVITVS